MSGTTSRQLTIGLRADWGTGPLWVSEGEDFPDPYGTDEITEVTPLSDELSEAISAWDERFQSIYNDESPQDSKFSSEDDEATFIREGEQLAHRIRSEVPTYIVVRYWPLLSGKWVTID